MQNKNDNNLTVKKLGHSFSKDINQKANLEIKRINKFLTNKILKTFNRRYHFYF
jgi:hypothetical protein